jgi:hypothetical protein
MADYWSELNRPPSSGPSNPEVDSLVPTNRALVRRARHGARWIWVIAALSAINLILIMVRSPFQVAYGFGGTELIYAIGVYDGQSAKEIALGIDALVIGAAALLGWGAYRLRVGAFIVAMVVFTLDVGILIWFIWLAHQFRLWSLAIHLLGIYWLWLAFKSAQLYQHRRQQGLV